MTTDLHHRRLRESRGAVLRAVWVATALSGGLAGGLGLQVAGAPLQAHMASLAGGLLGRPFGAPTLAVRGTADAACPNATLPGVAPGTQGASATVSAHHRVRVATLHVVAAPAI
jgi:hypothetical protein